MAELCYTHNESMTNGLRPYFHRTGGASRDAAAPRPMAPNAKLDRSRVLDVQTHVHLLVGGGRRIDLLHAQLEDVGMTVERQ